MGRPQGSDSTASGRAGTAATAQELPHPPGQDAVPAGGGPDLFANLPSSGRPLRTSAAGPLSVALHALVLVSLLLLPLLGEPPPPTERDYVRVLLYDPPPPPPPPLPKGTGAADRAPRADKAPSNPPEPRPSPALIAPVETPPSPPPVTVADEGLEAGGSPTGSDLGVPEGMEGGQDGGVVGGVPGGVLGGVVGGTGTLPVPAARYDRPPRLLRQVKPEYPNPAFVRKIEGVVVIEILIDESGRVVRARVTRSIPLLDAAAVAAVREWVFAPALQGGRPVATLATAPVSFHLY